MGFLIDGIFDAISMMELNYISKKAIAEINSDSYSYHEDTKAQREMRREQRKARKESFKEEIGRAIETDKQNADGYSEEFYQQITQFASDLYSCIDDFQEKAMEKYGDEEIFEYNDISEVYASDYDSESYDYERESKAKVACKEAIKSAISDMCQNFDEEKDNVIDSCKEFLNNMEEDIKKFISTFRASYEDYISLDCEGESEEYVQRMKDNIADSSKLLEMYRDLDIIGKFHSFIEETFDKPLEKLSDVQEYFVLCDYDEDDELYCYILDGAIDELNSKISGLYTDACDELEEEMAGMYETVLNGFAASMENSLIKMFQTTEM